MIDHTSFAVKNFEKSLAFYDKSLKALGYDRMVNIDIPEVKVVGYGITTRPRPSFWISDRGFNPAEEIGNALGVHLAFAAPSVEAVNEWYKICLELGGKDNGAPGPRVHYHPGYYGAFIIDPNGWRIEACFHQYQPI